jgi:hypothetical protein
MGKKIFFAVLVGLAYLSVSNSVRAQDSDKVVILSPRVGTMINAYEREHFQLFPQINGFVRAVVYQTAQKNYYAKLELIGADGKTRDTTIQYSENSLLMLAERIDRFEDLHLARGADVILLLKTGQEISGELVSVRDSSLVISTIEDANENDLLTQTAGIIAVRNEEILHVVIKGKSNVLKGMILGTLAGVGFHAVLGLAIGANPLKAYFTDADPVAREAGMTYGAVGLLLGTVVGAASSSRDRLVEPLPDQDFSSLRPIARFPEEEPEFLKKIK